MFPDRLDELMTPSYMLTQPHSSGNDGTATNPRGIPYAPFVDRVEDYVATREEVEPTLRSFQEMIS